jgi:hypothetical protein
MSADQPSSNPFRRKGPSPTAPTENPSISTVNHIAYQQADPPQRSSSLEQVEVPKKATKKVRVQSPPPPSPSIPDSSSTIGEDSHSISEKPPTPIPRDDDPFDSTVSDTDEDEGIGKPTQAPANPFSKTLETMERPEREAAVIPPTNVASPGRASLDVEAFKRLLMTGSAGVGTSTPPHGPPAQVTHTLGDGGSSTDTSSLSRQSIFEAIQEAHAETPRTSHEISEPEDDRRVLTTDFTSSTPGRKKPPPPSSRHGKLIKVELRDDPPLAPITVQSPPTPGSITSQHYFSSSPRSQTDLNKPLPPAPNRASHESERESVFDREAAGKTPQPPSPSSSVRKKNPPAPPLSRRHSQLVHDSKLSRSDSGRLSPKAEEKTSSMAASESSGRPHSDSARAPPPPPSRRPGSIRASSHNPHNSPLTSPSATSLPPPPSTRGSSKHFASGRPLSVVSMETPTSNKRSSTMPPPPPPHRHGRGSMDGQSPGASRRPSGEQGRRSTESARRGSTTSSLSQAERTESNQAVGGHDILADLSALQREIDALRNQSEKERLT